MRQTWTKGHELVVTELVDRAEAFGQSIQHVVVEENQHAVAAPPKVNLATVRAGIHRGGVGFKCVFGHKRTGSSMHDDDRPGPPAL